jgi:hypothetical protein
MRERLTPRHRRPLTRGTDPTTTIVVAEWENEELGKPGQQRYREWLRSSGIAEKLSLETYDGPVVVAS